MLTGVLDGRNVARVRSGGFRLRTGKRREGFGLVVQPNVRVAHRHAHIAVLSFVLPDVREHPQQLRNSRLKVDLVINECHAADRRN